MIGLPGFKSGDFVFISAAEEICGNRTGFAVQFPPLAIVCILHAFGTLAGKNGLVAVLEADGDIVDLHHINNFHGGRRHGQYIAEPNGFAAIIHIDLIGCQGDFFAVDIELRVLIEAVALFHAQVGNLEIYAIGVTLSSFKFRNELAVVTLVPVVAGGNAIAAAVIGVPTLMVEINKRIHGTGHKARFVAGIKVDSSVKVDFLYSLTGTQLCSILNEAGFSVIHHHDPRTGRQTCSVQCNIFSVCQITVEGIAVFRLKFHGISVSSALLKCIELNIAVRIAVFIGIPVSNRAHGVVGILLTLFPALKENIIFILISACSLGRCLGGVARLIVELHIRNIDGRNSGACCRSRNFYGSGSQLAVAAVRAGLRHAITYGQLTLDQQGGVPCFAGIQGGGAAGEGGHTAASCHLHQRIGVAVVGIYREHDGRELTPIPCCIQGAAADSERLHIQSRADQQIVIIRVLAHRFPNGQRAVGQSQCLRFDTLGLHGAAGNIQLFRAVQLASVHDGAAGNGEQALIPRGTDRGHTDIAIHGFQRAAADGDAAGIGDLFIQIHIHINGTAEIAIVIGRLGAYCGEAAAVQPEAAAGNVCGIGTGHSHLSGIRHGQVARGNIQAVGHDGCFCHRLHTLGAQLAAAGHDDIAPEHLHATGERRSLGAALLQLIRLVGDGREGAAGDQQGLILGIAIHLDAEGEAAAVGLRTAATGRDPAALHGEVTVYADTGRINPAIAAVFKLAGEDAQCARACGTALNGEAARGVQSVDIGCIRVAAAYLQADIAALDGVVCAVLEDDGGSGGQLHRRLGGSGEVNAPQSQSLGGIIPEGLRRAGLVLIEQRYGLSALPDGEVCCFCCRSCRKYRQRHQRQHHAQREQDCQQLCLKRFILHSLNFLS